VGSGPQRPRAGFGERVRAAEPSGWGSFWQCSEQIPGPSPATERVPSPTAPFSGAGAAPFLKSANDIRLLGSGPRCGVGVTGVAESEESRAFQHHAGKVQSHPVRRPHHEVAFRVMGNNTAVQFAAKPRNFRTQRFQPCWPTLLEKLAPLLCGLQKAFRRFAIAGALWPTPPASRRAS